MDKLLKENIELIDEKQKDVLNNNESELSDNELDDVTGGGSVYRPFKPIGGY